MPKARFDDAATVCRVGDEVVKEVFCDENTIFAHHFITTRSVTVLSRAVFFIHKIYYHVNNIIIIIMSLTNRGNYYLVPQQSKRL